MKRNVWLFMSMLALLLAACEDPMQEVGGGQEEQVKPAQDSMTIKVVLDQAATKTMLSPNDLDNTIWEVLWSNDDKIRVFDAEHPSGVVFELTDGIGKVTGTFSGPALTGTGPFYAVYPASAATALATDGSISLTVPDTQVYGTVWDYVGVGSNISAGYTTDLTAGFTFKNLFGLLSLNVTNANSVSRVVLYTKGATDVLNGAFKLTGLQSETPAVVPDDDQLTELHQKLTLECGAGVDGIRALNLVVPAGTLDAGMTIELYDTGGKAMVMNAGAHSPTSDNPHFINRSHVRPMAEFAYSPQYKAGFLSPSTVEAGAFTGVKAADDASLSAVCPYVRGSGQYAYSATSDGRSVRIQDWTNGFALRLDLPATLTPGKKIDVGITALGNTGSIASSTNPVNMRVLKKSGNRIWLADVSGSNGYIMFVED